MKKLSLLLILLTFPVLMFSQKENNKMKTDSLTVTNKEVETKSIVEEKAATPTLKCVEGDCENGVGTKYYKSGTYMGSWKNGLRHGQGKYVWNNGDMYDGAWEDDQRQGYGVYKWHDGSLYKGNYNHGVRSGYGIYYYTNGNIYEGTWQNNLKHGIANFYFENSVNIGGKYIDNKYVDGTGITQESYKYKPRK